MAAQDDRVDAFRRLHAAGCFVMPNPWDAGSARALEQLGFKALATTSAGYAWTLGRADNQLRLDEALEHLRAVAGAVSVPVNADFEGGFADEPEQVAVNVKRAAATGIAGLSIEDSTGDPAEPLYEFDLAVERIRAARRAIDESGTGIVLTGRSEGFVVGRPDIDETIRRLQAYAEAGADCLYAPRIGTIEQVSAVVAAVAPEAGEPPDQRSVHHGRGGRLSRSAPDQRRGHARTHGLGGVPRGRTGDRRRGNVLAVRGLPGCRCAVQCSGTDVTARSRLPPRHVMWLPRRVLPPARSRLGGGRSACRAPTG